MKRRFILLVPLLALFAFVASTEERAEAADVAPHVEDENFDVKPTHTSIVDATMYQIGQALKSLSDTAIATETARLTRREGL